MRMVAPTGYHNHTTDSLRIYQLVQLRIILKEDQSTLNGHISSSKTYV